MVYVARDWYTVEGQATIAALNAVEAQARLKYDTAAARGGFDGLAIRSYLEGRRAALDDVVHSCGMIAALTHTVEKAKARVRERTPDYHQPHEELGTK